MINKRKYSSGFLKPDLAVAVLILLLLFRLPVGKAQEVISPAGAEYNNASLSVSWTLGEVAVHTFTSENHLLTQGFQQPNITVVSVDELVKLDFNIQAFPNPTKDFLTLSLDELPQKPLIYEVYTLKGQLIEQGSFSDLQTQISFSSYKAAYYIIQIIKENKPVKTFKISKTQ